MARTIVSPTGYPAQKPSGCSNIVNIHTSEGETLLDIFVGCGTAARNGREFIAIDRSKEATAVMQKRLAEWL